MSCILHHHLFTDNITFMKWYFFLLTLLNLSFLRMSININETTLLTTNFDSLDQAGWVHILRSLYHLFSTVVCITGNSTILWLLVSPAPSQSYYNSFTELDY